MSDNVIYPKQWQLPEQELYAAEIETTTEDIEARKMLEEIAKDETLEHVFVISWGANRKPLFHSSTCDTPVIIYRLQQFIHQYYQGHFGGEFKE